MSTEIKRISIKALVEDLNNGLTRFPEGEDYNESIGSIQTKYALERQHVIDIFKHPKLKGRKTKKYIQPAYILVDDLETRTTPIPSATNTEESTTSMKYGARPAKLAVKEVTTIDAPTIEVQQEQELGEISQF